MPVSSPDNIPTTHSTLPSKTKSKDLNFRVTSPNRSNQPSVTEKEDDSDSLLHASSVENKFRISDLKDRHKVSIPPPEKRDIVRKHIDTHNQVRAQSPLGSLLVQGPVPRTEVRSTSGLRVNSTGLPPPPSAGVPIIARNRRYFTSVSKLSH